MAEIKKIIRGQELIDLLYQKFGTIRDTYDRYLKARASNEDPPFPYATVDEIITEAQDLILTSGFDEWLPLEDLEADEGRSVIVAARHSDVVKGKMGFDMNIGDWIFAQMHFAKRSNIDYALAAGYKFYRPMFEPPK